MRKTRHPFVKCRKCETVYYRVKVEGDREVNPKASCRVCGAAFARRDGDQVFKYFRARRNTKTAAADGLE
jgi:hypothetical protein